MLIFYLDTESSANHPLFSAPKYSILLRPLRLIPHLSRIPLRSSSLSADKLPLKQGQLGKIYRCITRYGAIPLKRLFVFSFGDSV